MMGSPTLRLGTLAKLQNKHQKEKERGGGKQKHSSWVFLIVAVVLTIKIKIHETVFLCGKGQQTLPSLILS